MDVGIGAPRVNTHVPPDQPRWTPRQGRFTHMLDDETKGLDLQSM